MMTYAAAIHEASNDIWRAQHELVTARREWVLLMIERDKARAGETPEWRVFDEAKGECEDCGNYHNFGPARHPRTLEEGIVCCECGMHYINAEQKPYKERLAYYDAKRDDIRQKTRLNLDLSDEEFETWEASFGLPIIDKRCGFTPMRPTGWEPSPQ